MSIASIAYSMNKYKNLKVIWIDAHADINTTYSSKTNNYHGMPLSFLTGLDYDKRFNFIKNTLKFENILYIGLRDIDNYEKNVIKTCNIKTITAGDFNNNFEKSKEKIGKFLNCNKFHVSLDVDGIDPYFIPSTGTPVTNGLNIENTINLVNSFFKNNNMVNMDICELNLDIGSYDDRIISLNNTLKLINMGD